MEENDLSDFWEDQQKWEIITWRLYKACGVYIVELKDGTVIHMLVERRYPLSKDLLQRMLDLRLEVEKEICVELSILATTLNRLERSILNWDLHDVELKDTIVVAMPKLVGESSDVVKNLKTPRQAARDDNDFGTNGQNSNLVGNGPLNVVHGSSSNTPIIEKIDKLECQILNGKLTFVDDDRKALYMVITKGNEDSESEVEVVFNETTNLMASVSLKGGSDKGYGTKSLLEQWRETKRDDDYDQYDENLYESRDMSDHLQAIYDDLDITVHGQKIFDVC
ncbi:hypothetical protein Tco_0205862 [Tanacetum coccineum]